MLEALLLRPRRWPFALTYGLWWANHHYGQRTGIAAHLGSRLARTTLKWVSAVLRTIFRMLRWIRGK
jgi:hypothetical protein